MRYIGGMSAKDKGDLSRGFDAGNYGNAYETPSWDRFAHKRKLDERSAWFRKGALLGYFSSYELSEIADEEIRDEVRALRALHDYDACGTCGASLPDDYLRAHPYETRVRVCPDGCDED